MTPAPALPATLLPYPSPRLPIWTAAEPDRLMTAWPPKPIWKSPADTSVAVPPRFIVVSDPGLSPSRTPWLAPDPLRLTTDEPVTLTTWFAAYPATLLEKPVNR